MHVMTANRNVRLLSPGDIDLIGQIDRSEQVDVGYDVAGGVLHSRRVNWDVPAWGPAGSGGHNLSRGSGSWIRSCDEERRSSAPSKVRRFSAWLAFLHVSRPYRSSGVASALWETCAALAVKAGADSMYVSATPSGSAVGFYLSRGCELARPPHPDLLALEPEDIHFVCRLT